MTTFQRTLRWLSNHSYVIVIVVGIYFALLPEMGLGAYWQRQIALIAIYTMIVAGLNLTFGYAGELALGQVAVFAAGAYGSGILVSHDYTDILLGLAVAVVVSLVVGFITGIPSIRLGGWSLAVVTLFLLLIVPNIIDIFSGSTGGAEGLAGILGITLLGNPFGATDTYIMCVVVCVLVLLGLRNLVTSNFGLALRSMRESPLLVAALGSRARRLKLLAYVIASVPAGLAGWCFAYVFAYLNPISFSFTLMVALLAASILGGSASVWGAPLGAAVVVLGPLRFAGFQNYSTLAFGLFLIVMGLLLQGGVAGLLRRLLSRRFSWLIAGHTLADEVPAPTDWLRGSGSPVSELSIKNVAVQFGAVKVLSGVTFRACAGEVTALIGANGAGKTTLLNAVSGFAPLAEGTIAFGEVDLSGKPPESCAQLGLRRTFQTPHIPRDSTVFDVARSGAVTTDAPGVVGALVHGPKYRRWSRTSEQAAQAALALVGLDKVSQHVASSLPLGHRRLLEVARALVGRPGVVLLDEPAAGLDAADLEQLGRVILALRDSGCVVILVEHNVPFILGIADKVVALDFGKVLAVGTPSEIQDNEAVAASYLGSELGDIQDLDAANEASLTKSQTAAEV